MQRKAFTVFLTSLALIAMAGGNIAAAQSPLKELRARQAEERQLASEAAYTSNVCGTRISARIDWGRSGNWPAERSLADACDGALGAIEAICRGDGKQKVQSKISSFTCMGDGSGPALRGSGLSYGASPRGSGFSATRSYLERAL